MADARHIDHGEAESKMIEEMARFDAEWPRHRPWEQIVADVRALVARQEEEDPDA